MSTSPANIAASSRPPTLRDFLKKPAIRQSIADVIPKHMTPDKLVKLVLVAISRQPKLGECTLDSLLRSTMIASELGLSPTGTLGEGYLVPYKRNVKRPDGKWDYYMEAQFIAGYRGLISLARRSGNIRNIESHVVYVSDTFDLEFGLQPRLVHKPNLGDATRSDDDIIGAYVIARFKDGGDHVEFMTRAQIEGVRKRSKSGDSGPWETDYAEMARKTVVRRASKYWPMSTEDLIAKAIEVETRAESGQTIVDLVKDIPEALAENESAQIAAESEEPSRVAALTSRMQTSITMPTESPAQEPVSSQDAPFDADPPKQQEAPAPTPTTSPAPASIPMGKDEQLVIMMTDIYQCSPEQARASLEAFTNKLFKKSLSDSCAREVPFKSIAGNVQNKNIPLIQ